MKYSIVLLLLIAIFSCENEPSNNTTNTNIKKSSTLVRDVEGNINLPLDELSPQDSKTTHLLTYEGQNYLCIYNERIKSIDIYDLERSILHKRVRLHKDGKHRIFEPMGFYPHSLDRFAVPSVENRIYIVNAEGEVMKRHDISDIENHEIKIPITSLSLFNMSFIYKEGKYYAAQHDNSTNYLTDINVEDFKLAYEFDIETGSSKLMNISFPSDFRKNGTKELRFSWAYNGDEVVISPKVSNDLYLSKNLNKIDSIITYDEKIIPQFANYDINKIRNSPQSVYIEHLRGNSSYIGLLYDKYRKVYYRFYYNGKKLDYDNLDQEELDGLFINFPDFNILVLDQTFQILGEIELPKNTYVVHNSFVGEQGLYLTANHPKNPNINEDILALHLYKLE